MPTVSISSDQLLESYQWRYAVKRFDSSRRLDSSTWEALEKSLVLTPSSFGLQPWKFLIVTSPEYKAKLPAISWSQSQPAECSHMVVFAAMKSVGPEYVDRFLDQVAAVRRVGVQTLAPLRQVVLGFLQKNSGKHLAWSSNQAYIALGQLLASAAVLGVDACPMEGILLTEYDKLLGLEGTNYTSVVGCALGYRHPDDKYAFAPKVRFDDSELVTHL